MSVPGTSAHGTSAHGKRSKTGQDKIWGHHLSSVTAVQIVVVNVDGSYLKGDSSGAMVGIPRSELATVGSSVKRQATSDSKLFCPCTKVRYPDFE
jgi:hypothetical protein